MGLDILLASFVCALMLMVQHWFPWRLALRRKLPRLTAYILGTTAIGISLSGLYVYWLAEPPGYPRAHLIALWAVIVSGGLAVLLAYGIDEILHRLAHGSEMQELLDLKNGQIAESSQEKARPD